MQEVKIDRLQIDEKVSLSISNGKIAINIDGTGKLAFVTYSEELFEIIKNARFSVPDTQERIGKYKYPYSNEYKKTLHQIVFDYYFGEEHRTRAYELGYIIEHLDNDGFNCDISNLFVLKKVKNTYKGWNFDKEVKSALPVIALKIYHILKNKTFQITIAFNQTFNNQNSGKTIDKIKLLYDYNYEIVLQDAEQILESIVNTGRIDFNAWKELYRFKDIRVSHSPDIVLTEEEKKQGFGTLIFRGGKTYISIGESEESIGRIISTSYDKDWDLRSKTQIKLDKR